MMVANDKDMGWFSAYLTDKTYRKMEIEFLDWYSKNEDRFAHGQFDEKQIAYSAWLDGKKRSNKAENLPVSDVSGSFKHSVLDVWAFAEWCGLTYVRLNDCWVHRYADQRNKDNWKDTGELWKLWWENYR